MLVLRRALTVLALLAAAFVMAAPAHAQSTSPDCTIQGIAASCFPELWWGPGPADEVSYSWTGPNGFAATDQFVEVFDSGEYTLTVTRNSDGATNTCSRTFTQLPSEPPCAIAGPDHICAGQPVELCGPEGPFSFMWTGPDGWFLGSDRCVTVGTPGTYTLTVFAGECQTICSRDVPEVDCSTRAPQPNCPRGAGFWSQQCQQRGNGSTTFTADQLAAIAASVDAHSTLFAWQRPAGGFCEAINPGRPMNVRKQARRQFAAFLANLCTGEMRLVTSGGEVVSLDPGAPVTFDNHPTTLGELAQAVDGRLVELQNASLDDAAVRSECGRIADALGAFNDGDGLVVTCVMPTGSGSGMQSAAVEAQTSMSAWPNPFRASTTLSYSVEAGESADIGVFDLNGRLVKRLVDVQNVGTHSAMWDGTDGTGARARAGVYFVRGRVGQRMVRTQVLMLR